MSNSGGNGEQQGTERQAAVIKIARRGGSLPSMRALNELLDAPDAWRRIRKMPSVQLGHLVSQIGLANAGDLLALASASQVRDLVDLQVWNGNNVDIEELLDWVYAIIHAPAADTMEKIQALDIELLGLLLRSSTAIYLLEEHDLPDEPAGTLYRTPDGWFALDIRANAERASQVMEVVEALYGEDPDHVRRLLHNLIWELPSDLEQWCLRWRGGRLQDLGFADPQEAMEVYAYLDPATVDPAEGSADQPLSSDPEPIGEADPEAIVVPQPGAFWEQAMEGLDDRERRRISAALLAVANKTLSADNIPPGDLDLGRDTLRQLYWRLNLGLEQLCGGQLDRANEVLAGVALLRIARVGHSLVLQRREHLLELARRRVLGTNPGSVDRIESPLRDQLTALLGQRPLFFDVASGQTRPFESAKDLAVADDWIATALLSAKLASFSSTPPGPNSTFGDLFRTDLLNALAENSAQCAESRARRVREDKTGAVDHATVAAFIREHVSSGALLPDVRAKAHALAAHHHEPSDTADRSRLVALIDRWTDQLADAVADLDPEDFDPRFVGAFVWKS